MRGLAPCIKQYTFINIYKQIDMKRLDNNIIDLLVGGFRWCGGGGGGGGGGGRYQDNKVYITFEQSINHEDYITDIHNTLSTTDLDLENIKYYTRKDFRYNSTNTSIYFKLYSYELLNSLANSFLSK